MEVKAVKVQTGEVFEGGLDQIVTWLDIITDDHEKIDAIANVMADMEMIPEDSDVMEEKFVEINRLSDEIGVEFMPVKE